jgi:hypothetical protein
MLMHVLCMRATALPIQSLSIKVEWRMQSQSRKGTANPSMIPHAPKVEKERKGSLNAITATAAIISNQHA